MGRYYHNNYRNNGSYHRNNYYRNNNYYRGNPAPRQQPVAPAAQPNYIMLQSPQQPQIPLGERIFEGLVVSGLPSMIIAGIQAFTQVKQQEMLNNAPALPPPPEPPRMPTYTVGPDGKFYDEWGNEVIPRKN